MSKDFVKDINDMHLKYGVNEKVKEFDTEKLKEFFKFRFRFLEEELKELELAKTDDDAVDALIDLVVVALGTLDAFDVDIQLAWDRVLEANMNKEIGVKASRPNKLGLPDLIKPAGWEAPYHVDNVGLLYKVFGN